MSASERAETAFLTAPRVRHSVRVHSACVYSDVHGHFRARVFRRLVGLSCLFRVRKHAQYKKSNPIMSDSTIPISSGFREQLAKKKQRGQSYEHLLKTSLPPEFFDDE